VTFAALPRALVEAVRAAGESTPGATAAFDADGTLWREDVGEAFLQHLCERGWVKLPGGEDPYLAYLARVERDRAEGYAYAAQLHQGIEETALQEEADRFARAWVPRRLIAATQELFALCAEAGLRCAVVSASPVQIVRAAAPLVGVAVSRCLGMTTAVDGRGILTDRIVPPITYADGKVQALAQAGFGAPALGCGDSIHGDFPLLKAARIPVAVAPAQGSALAEEAIRRGWALLPA
jgi:phosphatidylglycerophosphatase C